MGSYAWVCICAVLILLGIEAERSSESWIRKHLKKFMKI
jgi:hypothetical protein